MLHKVIVIGDVMLDSYLYGNVVRISPEAPVPVFKFLMNKHRAGGAANVALNLNDLGSQVILLGIVGDDDNFQILNGILKKKKLTSFFTKSKNVFTITKQRLISSNQQLIRIDNESDYSEYSKKCDNLEVDLKNNLNNSKIVLISDYNKGSLSRVQKLIEISNLNNCKVLVDPKGNSFEKYKNSFLLTPNKKEFENIVGKSSSEKEFRIKAFELLKDLNLEYLLITRSEEGMTLIGKGNYCKYFEAETQEVYDVTGAGDTVIATIAHFLNNGINLEKAVFYSNIAASIVIKKIGTSTLKIEELNIKIN